MSPPSPDPVYVHSRREAWFSLGLWAAATLVSVSVSYSLGYGRPIEGLTFIAGIPDWVFWGVIVPWFLCLAASIYFALFVMRDDDLGEEVEVLPGEADEPEQRS